MASEKGNHSSDTSNRERVGTRTDSKEDSRPKGIRSKTKPTGAKKRKRGGGSQSADIKSGKENQPEEIQKLDKMEDIDSDDQIEIPEELPDLPKPINLKSKSLKVNNCLINKYLVLTVSLHGLKKA